MGFVDSPTTPAFPLTDPRGVITVTRAKICWGLLMGRTWLTINMPLFCTNCARQGASFGMVIFPSSQKASNRVGWLAHTERHAVMNGVFTQVVFM